MKKISEIMQDDHDEIFELFKKFKLSKNKKIFDKFRWQLERHMFTEEKCVFTSENFKDRDFARKAEGLVSQHEEIIERLNIASKKVKDNLIDIGWIQELERFVRRHSYSEDSQFYPELDIRLSEEEKKRIFEKMSSEIR